MSKKKDRKIKRLQRLAIWPAIVEMFIIETVILAMAIFICSLAIFGIINTLILNNSKECRAVVQYVNKDWDSVSREQLKERLKNFEKTYEDINGIYIDEQNDVRAVFPKLKNSFDEEAQRILSTVGMVHFVDPDYGNPYSSIVRTIGQTRYTLYNPKLFLRAMDVYKILRSNDFKT